jgi:hypothetical protein
VALNGCGILTTAKRFLGKINFGRKELTGT